MAIRKKIIAGTLAALALAATTAGAFAAPAYSTAHLNVRSGPGTGFRVVDVLSPDERVDIQYCRGSWCFLEKSGADGWASSSYLNRGWRDRDRDWGRDRDWDWDRDRDWDWDRHHGHHHDHDHDWDRDRDGWDRWDRWDRHHDSDARVCINGPNGYFCVGT